MGGTGTWMLAMADPDRFAAIAPICGSGIPWHATVLAKMPIFMYHGDCDDIVPFTESANMLRAVNRHGNKNARLKICYGVGHNAWDYAYTDDELLEWLLSQSK
jgi:predicted peptidase